MMTVDQIIKLANARAKELSITDNIYNLANQFYYGFFLGKVVKISYVSSSRSFEPFTDPQGITHYPKYYSWIESLITYDENRGMLRPYRYYIDEKFRLSWDYKVKKMSYDSLKQRCVFEEDVRVRQFLYDTVLEIKDEMDKILKRLKYIKHKEEIIKSGGVIDTSKDFDIAYLKTIPIDLFVTVNRAGFFKVRKEENTPSCKWFKNENTWVDFGGDNQRHDVIDLIMITQGLDFIGACKYLSVN